MDKRSWLRDEMNHYVKALAVFVITVAAVLIAFFTVEQREVERNVQEGIEENLRRQCHLLQLVLETNYGYLEAAAVHVAETEELLSEENKSTIVSIQNHTDLDRVALIDTDGFATYDNGATAQVAHRRYCIEALGGQRTLSDPVQSMLDGETKVVLGVPIRKDGEVVGILGGSLNVSALNQMLFQDVYGTGGDSMLVAGDGTFITGSRNAAGLEDEACSDFFTCYLTGSSASPQYLEQVTKDFEEQRSGGIKIRDKKEPTGLCYLNYMPIGLNGWILCHLIPEAVGQENYEFIRTYENYLIGALIVLAISLLLGFLLLNEKQQQRLLEAAQTDELTKLVNKITTQNQIDEYLKQEEERDVHAFLMLDIDKFKEINDTYGHAVGDEVLSQIGHLLRGHFRIGDIIGRIGGDEFVVFMSRIGCETCAVQRIEELNRKISELEIGAMKEHLTCSMGVAFAPEHGETYQELYQAADAALYQTKRRGRNGYTLYSKEA